MFEVPPTYAAFYVPAGHPVADAIALGVRWVTTTAEPGTPLVLLHAKSVLGKNRTLSDAVRRHGLAVSAPATVHKDGWSGGPVLAPWATSKVLTALDDELAEMVSAACVIAGSAGAEAVWVRAHQATDLVSGAQAPSPQIADPVVAVAMGHVTDSINHNNGLVQDDDRAYAVRTLQVLHGAGYRLDVDELAAWALAAGWPGGEVAELRDIAGRVLAGRTFQLRGGWGPGPDSLPRWVKEAAGQQP
ncbi:MAG TPA: hypothetical protein VNQ77_10885 [Frankiaceae bacterium]|nr:hypothetical protein [Frankiaceae bacterium]